MEPRSGRVRGSLGTGLPENIGDDETPLDSPLVDIGGRAVQLAAYEDLGTWALREDGKVFGWGPNQVPAFEADAVLGYGHLDVVGDDETPLQAGPLELGAPATSIGPRAAVLEGGRLKIFGNNDWDFGRGLQYRYEVLPKDAPDIPVGGPVVQIPAHGKVRCVLLSEQRVRCWGRGSQTGYGNMAGCEHLTRCPEDPSLFPTCCVGDDESPGDAGNVPYQ